MVAAELSPTFTAVSLSPAYLTEGTAKAQTQIKLYAFMRVMKVLSRPYRICDSPLTTGRSRLCRPTRRTKSSAQPSSARERPLTASKSEPIAPQIISKGADESRPCRSYTHRHPDLAVVPSTWACYKFLSLVPSHTGEATLHCADIYFLDSIPFRRSTCARHRRREL